MFNKNLCIYIVFAIATWVTIFGSTSIAAKLTCSQLFEGLSQSEIEYFNTVHAEAWTNLLSETKDPKARVYFLGESHGEVKVRSFYPQVIRTLKAAHPEIQYLFIEHTRESEDYEPFYQEAINGYMAGQKSFDSVLRTFRKSMSSPELYGPPKEVLDLAKELHLKVICSDGGVMNMDNRHSAMVEEITSVINNTNSMKGIMIVGSAHLTGESSFLPGDSTAVSELIKGRGLSSQKILIRSPSLSPSVEEGVVFKGLMGGSIPMGFIPTAGAPPIHSRKYDWQVRLPRWSDFDAVIAVP